MRGPGRLVLNHQQTLEGVQVRRHGVWLHRVGAADVLGQLRLADGGGHVARQGPEQPAHAERVPRLAADARHVHAAGVLHVAAVQPQRSRRRIADVGWPAANRDQLGRFGDRQLRPRRLLRLAVQQPLKRDGAGGTPALVERHWADSEPGEAARPRVAGAVVRRHRRPGEDETTPPRLRIHGATDMVPNRRRELPLVNEPGRIPREHGSRIDAHHRPGVGVHIQEHMAGRGLHRRGRLAHRPGAFDEHGPGGRQEVGEFGVYGAGQVGHKRFLPETPATIAFPGCHGNLLKGDSAAW